MANVITTKLDLDGKGFLTQIKTVKASIMEAEGATGKLKAGVGGLGDVLKNNAAAAAATAGTALLAFAAKSVQAFQQTALEAGKFADATGVSVEEASRLAEVASDVGIELGTVQGALQKFNKAAADGVVDVENFGNAVVRTSDGTVDAYQSFINAATAIGAIEDPARRAQAAQETFGRSYGEIAELMAMDATELRDALNSVGDAQVIDEEELAKAKAFRDGMDRISDAIASLQNAVGEAIVGNSALLETFADSLDTMAKYADEAMRIADAFLIVTNPLYQVQRVMGAVTDEINFQTASLEELNAWLDKNNASDELRAQALAAYEVAQASANAETERATGLTAGYNAEVSKNAALEVTAAENRRRGAEAGRYQAEATQILTKRLEDYLAELGSIPADIYTEIQAALNTGDLARAEALLNELARTRIAKIGIAIDSGVSAGVAAATGKLVGNAVSASIAAAVAGTKMPSSLGGGGGGGGGSSPAVEEANAWDAAIAKAYEYGEVTTQQYIDYLTQRLEGEDKYSDTYFQLWKQRQGLEQMLDDQAERRRKDEEAAAKEAADEAKRQADELKRQADEQARLIGNLTINVTNSGGELDPMQIKAAVEQAIRMTGRRFLGG